MILSWQKQVLQNGGSKSRMKRGYVGRIGAEMETSRRWEARRRTGDVETTGSEVKTDAKVVEGMGLEGVFPFPVN